MPNDRVSTEAGQLHREAKAKIEEIIPKVMSATANDIEARSEEARQAFIGVEPVVRKYSQEPEVYFAQAFASDAFDVDDQVTVKIVCSVRQPTKNSSAKESCVGDADDLFCFTASVNGPSDRIETYQLRWDFKDGSVRETKPVERSADGKELLQSVSHRFRGAGTYTVEVTNKEGQRKQFCTVEVTGGAGRFARLSASFHLTSGRMTFLTGALAVGSGFLTLYFADADWGSPKDYLNALLWGSVVSEGIKFVADMVDRAMKSLPNKA